MMTSTRHHARTLPAIICRARPICSSEQVPFAWFSSHRIHYSRAMPLSSLSSLFVLFVSFVVHTDLPIGIKIRPIIMPATGRQSIGDLLATLLVNLYRPV
ncbi:hypothetical protein ACMYR3_11920 [Ampullimonas aquatilis]|uniref:hypothetical protein n=1 Tax=Ampullimonas aquatilis TaxID=1341549 RepID=UPI003C71C363